MLNRYFFWEEDTTFAGDKIIMIGRIILIKNFCILVVFG